MPNPLNLIGDKYGRLLVISESDPSFTPQGRKIHMWNCVCDCGKEVVVSTSALRSGGAKSCGCYRNDRIKQSLFKDLTGRRYGRLTVIKRSSKKGKGTYWLCKCDCGNEKEILSQHLQRGLIRSCGCLRRDVLSSNSTNHGKSKTRIYKEWKGIKERCLNSKNNGFKNYGGRGITICKEWLDDFMNFYDWAMKNGYKNDLTIERKDVNGNYCPENCCWIPAHEQPKNTRNNVVLEYHGEKKIMADWARYAGIKYQTFVRRIKVSNWPIEKAIETPVMQSAAKSGK